MKKTTTKLLVCLLLLGLSFQLAAQHVTVTPNGITPASTHPRLSYDAIVALPSPQKGDIAYDLTFACLRVYNGSKWICSYQSPYDPSPSPNITAIAQIGGKGTDYRSSVAVDASGNVYVAGNYADTVAFGNLSKIAPAESDAFVAKYNNNGVLQWVQTLTSTGPSEAFAVKVDASGNVIVVGTYGGTAIFGSTSKTAVGNDVFIVKYNTNGVFQWVKTIEHFVFSPRLALDNSGNVYITGGFMNTITIETTSRTSLGSFDMMLAKFGSDGSLEWLQSAGGTGQDMGTKLTTDAAGNVYVTGHLYYTETFGGLSVVRKGETDMFVAKYNASGAIQWVQTAGGTSPDNAEAIVLDANGNVYVSGFFQGTASFGTINKTTNGGPDVFIVKYDNNGSFLDVQTFGGGEADFVKGMAVDNAGSIYVTGSFGGTLTFGNTSRTGLGDRDIFVVKYNIHGNFQWIQTAGSPGFEEPMDISIDSNKNIYVSGYFNETSNFGGVSYISTGSTDIFVARLQQQ